MNFSGFQPFQFDLRHCVDKLDIQSIVIAILKDSECANADEIKNLARQLAIERNVFRSSNPQDIQKYRDYIPKCIKLTTAIPWNAHKCVKAVKPGFQWGYSRDSKYTLAPERSLMIDVMACLYNCVTIQCHRAA